MRDTVERNAESVHGGVMKIADVRQGGNKFDRQRRVENH